MANKHYVIPYTAGKDGPRFTFRTEAPDVDAAIEQFKADVATHENRTVKAVVSSVSEVTRFDPPLEI